MLPTSVALTAGQALQVVDYRRLQATVTADGTGKAVKAFDPVPSGYLWLIQRASTFVTPGTGSPSLYLYVGDTSSGFIVDGTSTANLDIADEASPILLDSNEFLTAEWVNAPAGASCVFVAQYQLVQRVNGG